MYIPVEREIFCLRQYSFKYRCFYFVKLQKITRGYKRIQKVTGAYNRFQWGQKLQGVTRGYKEDYKEDYKELRKAI